MSVVEQGEYRRRIEAVRQLVEEISTSNNESIAPIIRTALEVSHMLLLADVFYVPGFLYYSVDGN